MRLQPLMTTFSIELSQLKYNMNGVLVIDYSNIIERSIGIEFAMWSLYYINLRNLQIYFPYLKTNFLFNTSYHFDIL